MPDSDPAGRRRWALLRWASIIFTATGGGLALWGFVIEPALLLTRTTALSPRGFSGSDLRIAVLTDLHVGSPFHSLDKLDRIVDRTLSANPDLIVILGDLVIHGVLGGTFVPPEAIAQRLGRLEAERGVFAVLGNHDHWLDARRVRRSLEDQGIVVLEDSAAALSSGDPPVWIAGVSDFWEGPHDVAKALATVPASASVLIITHNPDIFPEVPPRVALTIAGHTHGGQVRVPFLGTPIVPSNYGERFASGHVVEGGRHLFVATGTGTSMLPVRFRVPPTISLLDLSDPDDGG
ncbi:MAG: metallophosphoesterase [Gemmatimonadota bacterium]|nr:metallophosphoesterase [Gemmatimonadota bacterium]